GVLAVRPHPARLDPSPREGTGAQRGQPRPHHRRRPAAAAAGGAGALLGPRWASLGAERRGRDPRTAPPVHLCLRPRAHLHRVLRPVPGPHLRGRGAGTAARARCSHPPHPRPGTRHIRDCGARRDVPLAHSHAPATITAGHRKRLIIVLVVTGTVVIFQVVGALISGSLALLPDAGHMLTDATGVLIAL